MKTTIEELARNTRIAMRLLYIDLFCGAGGTSTGVERARVNGYGCFDERRSNACKHTRDYLFLRYKPSNNDLYA